MLTFTSMELVRFRIDPAAESSVVTCGVYEKEGEEVIYQWQKGFIGINLS